MNIRISVGNIDLNPLDDSTHVMGYAIMGINQIIGCNQIVFSCNDHLHKGPLRVISEREIEKKVEKDKKFRCI
jgi:hypothetical protein